MSVSKHTGSEITGSVSNRSKSFSTPAHSPQLITPNSTPPHPSFAEQRLQQLLMNCEAGTHSFHRDDGDDYTPAGPVGGAVGEMRRKSFAGGEALGQQKPGRRTSFLSSLSLSRPFGFTPSQPSSPATHASHHHNIPSGLAMTSSSPNSMASSPVVSAADMDRAKSTPPQPPILQTQSAQSVPKQQENELAIGMQRSKTQPNTPVKVHGFNFAGFGMTNANVEPPKERRHFDPGREPKLLGLL